MQRFYLSLVAKRKWWRGDVFRVYMGWYDCELIRVFTKSRALFRVWDFFLCYLACKCTTLSNQWLINSFASINVSYFTYLWVHYILFDFASNTVLINTITRRYWTEHNNLHFLQVCFLSSPPATFWAICLPHIPFVSTVEKVA